jgi:hypothetical protein
MLNDLKMRAFLIHLWAFVVVVAVLAGINLLTNPMTLWFVWVLIGWGIAVAAHDVALLLQMTHRRERIFNDPKMRAFLIHLFLYVAVNLVLLAVNLILTPQVWWFYWPMLGWGAGLIAHGWCAFRKHMPISPSGASVAQAREASAAEAKPPQKRSTTSKKPASRRSPKPRR